MSSKKKIRLAIASVVIILSVVMTLTGANSIGELFGAQSETVSTDLTEGFSVHIIECGQGSSTLVMSDGMTVLIDSGPNKSSDKIIAYLEKMDVDHLDYMIASHPHEDHIGGLDEVLNNFSVGTVIMPELPEHNQPTTKTYTNFLDAVENNGCKGIYADVGQQYSLGDATMTLLNPVPNTSYKDINNASVVARFEYGGSTAIVMGDSEKVVEKLILSMDYNIQSDLLVVGHHGSSSSSGDDFLEAIGGEFAAISLEADNMYGHPHDEVVDGLNRYGYIITRTDEVGDIVYVANSGSFVII